MPTLRELSFAIEANTAGLEKAIPVLNKLSGRMEVLATSIQKVAKGFETQSKRAVQAANATGAAHASASDKIKAALAKQNNQVEKARDKLTEMNKKLKELGREAGPLVGRNVQVFNRLEKSIRKGAASTSEFATRMSNFDTQLIRANRSLQGLSGGQRGLTTSTKGSEAALLRQVNTIEKNRERYLDLLAALEKTKSSKQRIDELKKAFIDLEKKMKGGALSTKDFGKAQNKFNAQLGKVRRSSNITSPELQAVANKMTDLSKSVQVALGPLSGVAARLTAFTALANRNSIAVAGVIAGIIAFGVSLVKAISIGADYEKQLLRLDSVLSATGHRAGLTATEINALAKEIGEITLTTQSAARSAATTFLTLRNASKEIAREALLAAQGMALIGRGDIQSQMRRLARVLEDPINNLKSLSESAIFFDATQERLIRNLQESGDLLGAQKVVLERLKPVMEAATGEAKGLSGAWDTFKETLTSFAQDAAVSGGSVKVLTSIVTDLTQRLKDINSGTDVAINLGTSYRLVIDGLAKIISFLVNNMKVLISVIGVFVGLRIVIALITMATKFKILGEALFFVVKKFAVLTHAIATTARIIVSFGLLIASSLTIPMIGLVAVLGTVAIVFFKFPRLFDRMVVGIKNFGSAMGSVFDAVFGSDVVAKAKGFFTNISEVIDRWAGEVVALVSKTFSGISEKIFGDNDLEKSFKRGMRAVKQLEIQMNRSFGQSRLTEDMEKNFKVAFERIARHFNDALVTGDKDDPEFMKKLDAQVSQIQEILGRLPFEGDPSSTVIEEIAEALGKMAKELIKTTGFQSRFNDEQEDALVTLALLSKKHLTLETAQRTARNELTRFLDDWKDMLDALEIGKDDIFPFTRVEMEKLGIALGKLADPIERIITGFENQIILQELAAKIALAEGEALSKLTLEFDLLNQLMSSGIVPVLRYIKELKKIATPQQLEQIERMEKRLRELQDATSITVQSGFIKDLKDEVKLRDTQIDLVRISSFEREKGLRLRQREIELLNEAGNKTKSLTLETKRLITEGVTKDFVQQYEEANKALDDQIQILDEELSLLHLSEAARADVIFLTEAQLKFERQFAGIVDDRIKKEVFLSKVFQIRERNRNIAHVAEIDDLGRRGEVLQAELELLFATENRRQFELAMLEKRQELMQREGTLLNERAKHELEIFRILELQEIQLRELAQLADILESSFSSFFDNLVDGFAKGELTAKSFKETVVAALQEIAAELLKLAITDKLVESLMVAAGFATKAAFGSSGFLPTPLGPEVVLPTPIVSPPSLQHGGIIPHDDFIASLHKGEKVIPLDSDPSVNVEVVINDQRGANAPDLQVSQQASGTQLRQIVIDIFAEDARSGGPASRAIAGTFGLRRHGRNR